MKPKTINVSSTILNAHTISILEKGIKFRPTLKPNISETKSDVLKFYKFLRKCFGSDSITDESLVCNTSNCVHKRGKDALLYCSVDTITNISREEQRSTVETF